MNQHDELPLHALQVAVRPLECVPVEAHPHEQHFLILDPRTGSVAHDVTLAHETFSDQTRLRWKLLDLRVELKARGYALEPWVPPPDLEWLMAAAQREDVEHDAPPASIPHGRAGFTSR
ncbi:MAG TPA: hypothetical protein VEY50_09005 [Lysobacter sp.]|nr:hypothetical protein [Lysobacter sp.]